MISQEELAELCDYWQKELRLQDWIVSAKLYRSYDFITENSQGETTWVLPKRSAIIKLLDPLDYWPNAQTQQDIETTLIHELLHLYMAPFWDNESGIKQDAQEQMIDGIAQALVRLKRQAMKFRSECVRS